MFRDWFYVDVSPSTLQFLMVFTGPVAMRLALNTSRQVQVRIGSSALAVGSPVTAGAYHSVDGLCDVTTTTASFTARVDGGADATLTAAIAESSDFTTWAYDVSGNNTMTIDHDQLRMYNTASAYPLADA